MGSFEMNQTSARLFGLIVAGLFTASAAGASAPDTATYKSPHATIEARVEDLLARMSLEEKVAQMQSIWEAKSDVFDANLEFDPTKMAAKFSNRIGQFVPPPAATG